MFDYWAGVLSILGIYLVALVVMIWAVGHTGVRVIACPSYTTQPARPENPALRLPPIYADLSVD